MSLDTARLCAMLFGLPPHLHPHALAPRTRRYGVIGLISLLLGACAVPTAQQQPTGTETSAASAGEQRPPPPPSVAQTPRDYRRDGAEHIYRINQDKIFHGQMPPLLASISVTRLFIDGSGRITKFEWLREPRDQPHIAREIQRIVSDAQPFPVPETLGEVAYVDTWLWHRNGLFQLDTLTEGQLDRKPIED